MNSHLPVGRLANRLETLSREGTWWMILIAMAALTVTDRQRPELGIVPLYIPIICAAAWKLGERAGYFVALIAALMATLVYFDGTPGLSGPVMTVRVAFRVITYLFIAAIITSFRRSYDRELFHAHQDRMTGALNKEVFHQRCAKAIEDAGHAGQTLLLVILDLDDFKAVNSRQGHLIGDEVLRSFAKGASTIMRREDLIGRIGGDDEFALLVRVPSVGEGHDFALEIHARLSAVLGGIPYPVTCSMGALLIPPEAPRDITELLHAADQAMYRAKKAGKNAIFVGRADVPGMPAVDRLFAQRLEGFAASR
ncbi:diguanylate cyclase [Sphingobium sp. C100]|jgi:diguanylate cyclase (GGDEF)-like protein|nr:diguanylate cyclase [Sphingobium sp. C100]